MSTIKKSDHIVKIIAGIYFNSLLNPAGKVTLSIFFGMVNDSSDASKLCPKRQKPYNFLFDLIFSSNIILKQEIFFTVDRISVQKKLTNV